MARQVEDKAPDSSKSAIRSGQALRIFVSYRRSDSPAATGRLTDALARAFGDTAFFRDINSIKPGANWATAIEDALESCDVVLAIIGPKWLELLQSSGDSPAQTDWLRFELKTALVQGTYLIPILVDGAKTPSKQELPEDLRPLAELQSQDLLDSRWEHDVECLVKLLRERLYQHGKHDTPKVRPNHGILAAVIVALTTVVLLGVIASGAPVGGTTGLSATTSDLLAQLTDRPARDGGITLLLVGGVLAIARALFIKYRDAVAARVEAWLGNAHVLGVVTVGLIAVTVSLWFERWISAVVGLTIAAAYLVVRRVGPRLFASSGRFAVAAGVALTTLAAAVAADFHLAASREASVDVAFLIPPTAEGEIRTDPESVFKDIRSTMQVSLQSTKIEIAPEALKKGDINRYDFANVGELLRYKAPRGYAKVFIRVRYTQDPSSGEQRMVMTPYLRTSRASAIDRHEGWHNYLVFCGRTGWREATIKASFEVVSFLASKGSIRLTDDELQNFWQKLLDEYAEALTLAGENLPMVETVKNMRTQGKSLAVEDMRRVLVAPCAPKDGIRVAEDKAVGTVAAVYGSMLGK